MSDYLDAEDFGDDQYDDDEFDAERDIGALHPEWSGVFETRIVGPRFAALDDEQRST